jgi:hypothetical protein
MTLSFPNSAFASRASLNSEVMMLNLFPLGQVHRVLDDAIKV